MKKPTLVHSQNINGHIKVEYMPDNFVLITDEETGHVVPLHITAIELINKTIQGNKKYGKSLIES